jgi:hypothetical protein
MNDCWAAVSLQKEKAALVNKTKIFSLIYPSGGRLRLLAVVPEGGIAESKLPGGGIPLNENQYR